MKKPPVIPLRQRERLAGYLEQKPRLGPETVHIDIANACNLDCVTCWNYAPGLIEPKSAIWRGQRMSSATFYRVLDEIVACGVERIILSGGGEPFTHPDIYAFIGAVKAHHLGLTIITNGTLCDFTELADAGVDQLLVNVSSASAASYVAYHPNQPEHSFQQLLDGIGSVRGRVAVNMVQVINAINADELLRMIELAHGVGARVSFKLGDTPPGTEQCGLRREQRQILLARWVPEAQRRARELGVKHNLDAFAAQLSGAPAGEGAPACFAGYLYSRVYVDGRVFFCCEHIEVGHVDAADFSALWSGAGYQAVRQKLHRNEAYPGCARCGKHDMNFSAARQLNVMQATG